MSVDQEGDCEDECRHDAKDKCLDDLVTFNDCVDNRCSGATDCASEANDMQDDCP
jgi:hypothetical protein